VTGTADKKNEVGPMAWSTCLRADETTLWATAIVAVAYWANIVRAAAADQPFSLEGAANAVLGNGAFDVFAWAMVLTRCVTSRDRRQATPRQVVVALLAGVIVLVPVRLAPALALVLLGVTLFTDREVPPRRRQMRLVLFALAAETVWMTVLEPLHVLIGRLDAEAAAALLRLLGQVAAAHGNVVDNITAQFSIVVWAYCTSTFPFADLALAFVVIVIYRDQVLQRAQLPWLLLSFAASVVLTEVRLMLLVWSPASYQWWHSGPGLTVYVLIALALAVALPLWATAGGKAGEGTTLARPAT
jgi:hypothetical protein